ncbi:MAG: hypothetical protein AAGA60_13335 [Cyanobacteria bacterium P01_E01_bin.42]
MTSPRFKKTGTLWLTHRKRVETALSWLIGYAEVSSASLNRFLQACQQTPTSLG